MVAIFTPMLMDFPGYITDPNLSLAQRVILLGFLLGLYPLGTFCGSPFLIHFSEKYGRKPVLIISLIITSIAYFGMFFCLQHHLLLFLLGFIFLAGLSEANLAIAECAIADFALPHHHRRYLTYIHVVWSLAFFCGPLAAALLTTNGFGPKPEHGFHPSTTFAFLGLLLLTGVIWMALFFKETKEKISMEYIRAEKAFLHFLSGFFKKNMRSFYGINFFFYLAIFGYMRAYPMHLVHQFHLTIGELAIYSAWVMVPILVTDFWFTGWAQKRFSTKSLLVFGGLLTTIGMFLTALAIPEGAWLWLILFVTAFGMGCCMPLCPFFITHKAPHELYGVLLGQDEALRTGSEALATSSVGCLAALLIPFPLIVFALSALFGTLLLALKK